MEKSGKPSKRIIVAGIVCFVVGVASLVFGLVLGANFRLYVDGGGVRFATEHTVEILPEGMFASISVYSNTANIEISRGVSFSAVLFTNYNDVEVSYYINDDVLYVYVEKSSVVMFYPGFGRPESLLTIYLPAHIGELRSLSITNTSYDTVIRGLVVEELSIEAGDGDVYIVDTVGYDSQIIIYNGDGLFEGLRFDGFRVGTFAGSSTFYGNNFYELFVSSQNGSIYLDGCRVTWFDANSRYGNIMARDIVTGISLDGEIVGHMYARNIFGDVLLDGAFYGRQNRANSTHGNITLYVNAIQESFDYRLSTNGFVYVNGERTLLTLTDTSAPNYIRALSRVGTIRLTFLYDAVSENGLIA